MPTTVRLRDDEREWVATLDGQTVSIADGAAFAIDDLAGGVVAVAGDVVWVGAGGEMFVFTVVPASEKKRAGAGGADALTPPMPATVVRVAVKAGDRVAAGDTVVVLEAMKMELAIRAPRDGIVARVNCREGDLVQPGTVLVDM